MPTHSSHVSFESLDRYFRGESSQGEVEAIEAASEHHPELRALTRFVNGAPVDTDVLWTKFSVAKTPAPKQRPRISWRPSFAIGLGASVAIVGVLFHLARKGEQVPAKTSLVAHSTGTGQRAIIQLTDGSQVILAPQSTLTMTRVKGGSSSGRVLSLVGQARFTVATHSTTPFLIRTAGVTTRVLGTSFDVIRYPSDSTISVTVWSGKVAVSGRQPLATLSAGMTGAFTDSTGVTKQIDSSVKVNWTEGRLSFKAAPVPVVLETLNRWGGYNFRITDSALAQRQVTAVFDVDARTETLHLLKWLLRVTMTVDDSVIVLQPDPNSRRSPAPLRRDAPSMSPLSTEFGK